MSHRQEISAVTCRCVADIDGQILITLQLLVAWCTCRYAPKEWKAGNDGFRKILSITSLLFYYLSLSALAVYHTASRKHQVPPSKVPPESLTSRQCPPPGTAALGLALAPQWGPPGTWPYPVAHPPQMFPALPPHLRAVEGGAVPRALLWCVSCAGGHLY